MRTVKASLQKFVRGLGYELRDANYYPQSHERKIYEYYLKNGSDIKTVFDVGANVGQTALGFHQSFPDATIYSFEPFAGTCKQLVANTAGISKIHCIPAALGDSDRTITIASEYDGSVTNSLLDVKQEKLHKQAAGNIETITVRSGKSFCAEKNITRIDILKIDTEGYEIPVLEGFGEMLQTGVQCVLTEFCLLVNASLQTSLLTLTDYLTPRGFSLVGFYDIRHERAGTFHYGNALFLHADSLKESYELVFA